MAVGEYYTSSVVALCVSMCELGAAWLCRVSWMDEHTDVDDGRRASVGVSGVERGWPCTSHITPRGRVGGRKAQRTVRCRVAVWENEKKFYLPCTTPSAEVQPASDATCSAVVWLASLSRLPLSRSGRASLVG